MSTFYERFRFLEFFDKERIVNLGQDVIEYDILIHEKFILTLHLNTVREVVVIIFKYSDWEKPLLEVSIENILRVSVVQEPNKNLVLKLYREENDEPIFSLPLKPFFNIQGRLK